LTTENCQKTAKDEAFIDDYSELGIANTFPKDLGHWG